MAQFYNKENKLVTVTIDGWSDYQIEGLSITGNDVSDNLFVGIHTSQLSLSVVTSDKSIYTGSLIGKNVTVQIGDEVRVFVIVTNVGDMAANYASESVRIEAVDRLLMLKNERYEQRGYASIKSILGNILGGFVLCDGWGGVSGLLSMSVNTAVLWTDDNNTAPTKWDVLEAIVQYINRALAYDYGLGVYVLYSAWLSEDEVDCVVVDGEDEDKTVYRFRSRVLNADSIASSDRSVTLSDPWQSAMIEAEYNDVEVSHSDVSYDSSTYDDGILQANGKKYKYDAYYGEDEGSYVLPDGKLFSDLSVTNIKGWVDGGLRGGCNINIGSQEISGEDAEGVRRGDDYAMIFGANNVPSNTPVALLTKVYDCDVMVTDRVNTYIVLNDSVVYSNLPIADDVGSFTAYRPYVGFLIKLTWADGVVTDVNGIPLTGGFLGGNPYVGVMLDGADAKKNLGTTYRTVTNVTWGDHLQTDGYKIKIAANSLLHGNNQLKKVEVSLCPRLWYSESLAQDGVVAGKYEFHKFDLAVEVSAQVDSSVFDTNTIYKWENDLSAGVTINGREHDDRPVFVTYDGKKAGNNCVIAGRDYAGAMDDEMRYYGLKCNSEERAVADLGNQYGRNVFSEVVSVKGLVSPMTKWRDSYFEKNCVPVALDLDIVEATSRVTLMEVM